MRALHLLTAFIMSWSVASGQALSFSQFYNLRTSLNPAYVSAVSGIEVVGGYRRQWSQVQEGVQTAYVSVAMHPCHLPFGLGLYAVDTREPFFGYRQQEAGAQFGGFWGSGKTEDWSFHTGGQAGIGQQRVDYARLLFSGQLDPLYGVVNAPPAFFQGDGSRVQTFDMGIGFVARGPWRSGNDYEAPMSWGFSVLHLAGAHDVSFLRIGGGQSTRWTGHGAVAFPLANEFRTRTVAYLNLLLRVEGESTLERTTLGAIFQYDQVNFGLLYHSNRNPVNPRNTNALSLVLGADLKFGKNIQCRLQYSLDGVLSGLSQEASGGGHELTAIFTFPQTCVLPGLNAKGRDNRGKTNCFHFAGKGYRGFF
ncbi:MAG: PorP/SprF family type IX secretion system membrane protein [Saprospiraceae bacterium]|nr:PorP/SprF family type IX secretion system membrane protein [Saprospiraceae bacterium]